MSLECRPIVAKLTARGSMWGGLLWEANPAYLRFREAQLFWDGARRNVTWSQRFSAIAVSRAFSPSERGPQTWQEALAVAQELQTYRANSLVYAVQRAARGQPLPVKVAPMLACAEHGSAALVDSFTADMNCGKQCDAAGAAAGQLYSAPQHVLDHTPDGMVSRPQCPTDFDGWSRPRLLEAFGSLLPQHVTAAVNEVPAVRSAMAAGVVLAAQRECADTADARQQEVRQEVMTRSHRCNVLDLLRLRWGLGPFS